MQIKEIKKGNCALVSLDSEEIKILTNIMSILKEQQNEIENPLYQKLQSDLIFARDLCLYGHIDDFSLAEIVNCRGPEKIQKTINAINEINNKEIE